MNLPAGAAYYLILVKETEIETAVAAGCAFALQLQPHPLNAAACCVLLLHLHLSDDLDALNHCLYPQHVLALLACALSHSCYGLPWLSCKYVKGL